MTLTAFAALTLYGTLRWSELLTGGTSHHRLLGLFVLSITLAGAGSLLRGRPRRLLVPLAVVALAATLAVSGMPVSWIVHLRVAVAARAIGQGFSVLPRLLVPYNGFNQSARMVIVLGAGLLELTAALMVAAAPRRAGLVRRAAAALPLIALAVIPATIVHPVFAYLQGGVLFALLAAFMWGDRVPTEDAPAAVWLVAGALIAAMAIAPGLDRHHPWFDYQQLTARLASRGAESFDWTQRYGPIDWPRNERTVLQVQAPRPDYWKAANLDVFDGSGWAQGSLPLSAATAPGVPAATLARYTQTLRVTLVSMNTSDVVAAGGAARPAGLPGVAQTGTSPGTWVTPTALGPGDSYVVKVYDPQPAARQLATAGTGYPAALLPGYLTVLVPAAPGSLPTTAPVVLPPFGSPRGTRSGSDASPAAGALDASPYARTYALARQLASRSPTPYAYVGAVERYLARGYSYNEDPPPSRFPLESFLFASRQGYCQQFAGAMALLLRLGGVPARVAVGFTPGRYDTATRQWAVGDLDAHAWVEAFFPGYGWVRFDPTPAADPALGGHAGPSAAGGSAAGGAANRSRRPAARVPLGARGARTAAARPGGGVPVVLIAIAAVLIVLLAASARRLGPLGEPDARLDELERAFSRTGRPLACGSTLAELERRLRDVPEAASYVRTLRLERFGTGAGGVTRAQRRAMREVLSEGLGPLGGLRALWALPPRRTA